MPSTITTLTRSEFPVFQSDPGSSLNQLIWPLKIYTLGRFGLVHDGVPILISGKVPRKPLDLLKHSLPSVAGVSLKSG